MRKYFIAALLVLIPGLAYGAASDNLLPQSNPQTDQSATNLQAPMQSTLQPASQAAQPSNVNPSQSNQANQVITSYLAGEADGSPHSTSGALAAKFLQLAAVGLAIVAIWFFARAATTSHKAAS